MSRRDTIIVAILVNAGLLMVLFATATKSKASTVPSQHQIVQEVPRVEKKVHKQPIVGSTLDELLFAAEEPRILELPLEEEEIVLTDERVEPTHYVTITVKQGDVLEKIARANHTTIAHIVEANQLSNTKLTLGQQLKVPIGKESPSLVAPSLSSEDFYIVKDGDNPWLIASKSKVRLEELLKLNNLDEKSAKKLRPGDRLRIR